MKLGDTFSSFEEFSKKLTAFQGSSLTQFTTLSAAKLKDEDDLASTFKYWKLRLVCKQGTKTHQPDGLQQRPNQRSFKVGCPVMMNVRLNRPKGKAPFLKVTKLELEHQNHVVSQEIFQLYPEQRRLQLDETDATVLSSMTMKTSEQRAILERRHGKALLSQDVYNIQRHQSLLAGSSTVDEINCDGIMQDVIQGGGVAEIGKSDSGAFLFVCFMTKEMVDVVRRYPECLIMDCTYKVNNYLYPLLTVMSIDGEGHGLPVFHAFLAKEDRHIMEKCLHVFAQQYDKSLTSCFIVDKDMAEHAALGVVFPDVPINLCHFHISQAVDRYLKKETGRGLSFVRLVLETFMRQVCTESETEYEELKSEISKIVPQPVIEYFDHHWWCKRHLWAACCNINVVKFQATTTNTLESYHAKIKKTINEKMSLSKTIASLISFDRTKISDSTRKNLIKATSQVYDHRDSDPTLVEITSCMTRFSGDLVKRELSLSREVKYKVANVELETYCLSYKDREHVTSITSCSCSTYGHLKIPCRHVFFLRNFLDISLFEKSLIPTRFLQAVSVSCSEQVPSHASQIVVNSFPQAPISSSTVEGRYKKAKSLCENVVNFLSILGRDEFIEKFAELEALLKSWSSEADPVVYSDTSFSAADVNSDASSPRPVEDTIMLDSIPISITSVMSSLPVSECADVEKNSNSAISFLQAAPVSVLESDSISCNSSPKSFSEAAVSEPAISVSSTSVVDTFSSVSFSGTASCVDPTLSSPSRSVFDMYSGSEQCLVDVHVSGANQHEAADNVIAPPLAVSGSLSVPHDSCSWPKMSRLVKPRGRPNTKQRFTLSKKGGVKRSRNIPKPYEDISEELRHQLLLSSVSLHHTIPNTLICFDEVKPFTAFSDTVLDERVDISCIEHFFKSAAWEKVTDGIASRRHDALYFCGLCKDVDDHQLKMIQCECCLVWFHFHCVGYSSKKVVKTWFCDNCL